MIRPWASPNSLTYLVVFKCQYYSVHRRIGKNKQHHYRKRYHCIQLPVSFEILAEGFVISRHGFLFLLHLHFFPFPLVISKEKSSSDFTYNFTHLFSKINRQFLFLPYSFFNVLSALKTAQKKAGQIKPSGLFSPNIHFLQGFIHFLMYL